jgi:thiol-disulfide isomerase/thioredoxin
MKKPNRIPALAAISCCILLHSCAEKHYADQYKLKGTIRGVDTGSVKLVRYNEADRTSTTLDSTTFKEGKFTLEGPLQAPEMMTLMIQPGNWSVPVFVENNELTIQADTLDAAHYDWTAYGGAKGAEIKKYTVSGSANQNNWMQYQNDPVLKKYEPQFEKLQAAYTAAANNKEEANRIKEEMDSLRTLLTGLQKHWIDSFVAANPSSAAGTYMLSNYYMYNEDLPLSEMEAMVSRFSGPATSTIYFKNLSDAVAKRKALQPGHTAPDFTLLKRDSSNFTLSSLRGKYVLLDFWASWCVPCRKAIPHWKDVYQKYQPKGLEIVSITNDSRWSDWFKAMDDEQMPWLQVADEFPVNNMPARVAELYMIPYLPTYILLDEQGKIVLHNGTEEQIGEKLKKIFGS